MLLEETKITVIIILGPASLLFISPALSAFLARFAQRFSFERGSLLVTAADRCHGVPLTRRSTFLLLQIHIERFLEN